MKPYCWLAICLWFSWSVTACGQPLPDATPSATTLPTSIIAPVTPTLPDTAPLTRPIQTMPHLLLDSTGTVKLKRVDEGWSTFQPIENHTPLLPNDLLEVEGQAVVLCAGTQQVILETGPNDILCRRQPARFQYNGAEYNVPQRPGDVPYVLYPRRTLLLDERPALIWHDTGADTYQLTLLAQQTGESWRETATATTEISYPAQWPPLQPGVSYLLLVTDETEAEDQTPGIGFALADEAQLQEMEQDTQTIAALPDLDETERTFILAAYYATHKPDPGAEWQPVGEAWRNFEALAQTHNTPALHLWRGYTLMEMLLPLEAEAAFKAAIAAAEPVDDLETQARAYTVLGQLNCEETYFNQAEALYTSLDAQTELVQKSKEGCSELE